MKKLILFAMVTLLFASCQPTKKHGIDMVGRWYAYMDDKCTEVDSTAYFDFKKDQTYDRRYHNAGHLEVGGYAVTGKTQKNYGNMRSLRVSLQNQAGETYYADIVQDKDKYMFVFTYQINNNEDIVYFTKEKNSAPEK